MVARRIGIRLSGTGYRHVSKRFQALDVQAYARQRTHTLHAFNHGYSCTAKRLLHCYLNYTRTSYERNSSVHQEILRSDPTESGWRYRTRTWIGSAAVQGPAVYIVETHEDSNSPLQSKVAASLCLWMVPLKSRSKLDRSGYSNTHVICRSPVVKRDVASPISNRPLVSSKVGNVVTG